jgi:hypothetical protein
MDRALKNTLLAMAKIVPYAVANAEHSGRESCLP